MLHDVRLHIWRAPASRVKVHAASPTKYRAASCESRPRSRVNDHVPQPVRPHTRVDTHTEAAASQTLQVGSLSRRRSSRHKVGYRMYIPTCTPPSKDCACTVRANGRINPVSWRRACIRAADDEGCNSPFKYRCVYRAGHAGKATRYSAI